MARPKSGGRKLSRAREQGEAVIGTVVRQNARHAIVRLPDRDKPLRCTLRKSLFHSAGSEHSPLAVGDDVEVTMFGPRDAVVEARRPRRGGLSRRNSEGREQVIVANVDQVLAVASLKDPEFKPRLVDRIMVATERGGFEGLVALTKIDLCQDRSVPEAWVELYESLGYKALLVSSVTGEGIDELREHLANRITVLSGLSGVGKSTTLNAIQPGLGLAAKTISEKWGKGRHTTTAVSLMPLEVGGHVVDTPGIRTFGLAGLGPSDVAVFMPDLAKFVEDCRHSNCIHSHEPDCAVKRAVEDGDIVDLRYESYLRMISGIQEDEDEHALPTKGSGRPDAPDEPDASEH